MDLIRDVICVKCNKRGTARVNADGRRKDANGRYLVVCPSCGEGGDADCYSFRVLYGDPKLRKHRGKTN